MSPACGGSYRSQSRSSDTGPRRVVSSDGHTRSKPARKYDRAVPVEMHRSKGVTLTGVQRESWPAGYMDDKEHA